MVTYWDSKWGSAGARDYYPTAEQSCHFYKGFNSQSFMIDVT